MFCVQVLKLTVVFSFHFKSAPPFRVMNTMVDEKSGIYLLKKIRQLLNVCLMMADKMGYPYVFFNTLNRMKICSIPPGLLGGKLV